MVSNVKNFLQLFFNPLIERMSLGKFGGNVLGRHFRFLFADAEDLVESIFFIDDNHFYFPDVARYLAGEVSIMPQ